MTVRYPAMRRECTRALRKLSDPEYQERVWVKGIMPPNYVDSFSEVIHEFFDDSPLADNPEICVGDILENSAEVEAIRSVTQLIDQLLDKYGRHLKKDTEYMAKPEFAEIIEAARAACKVFGITQIGGLEDPESS